jgi:hypothetical protein
MKKLPAYFLVTILLLAVTLSGCGGGSSDKKMSLRLSVSSIPQSPVRSIKPTIR